MKACAQQGVLGRRKRWRTGEACLESFKKLRHLGFFFIYSFFSGGKYQISFSPNGVVTDVDDVSGLASLPR